MLFSCQSFTVLLATRGLTQVLAAVVTVMTEFRFELGGVFGFELEGVFCDGYFGASFGGSAWFDWFNYHIGVPHFGESVLFI